MRKKSKGNRAFILGVAGFTGSLLAALPVMAVESIPVKSLRVEKAEKAGSLKIGDAPAIAFSWGGFVKIDAIASNFTKGDSLSPNGRDFYVPGATPVGDADDSQTSLDFIAKETRLFFKTDTEFDNGDKVGTYLEMDFLVNPGAATANVTNAYSPGLRRAYITFNNWLFGQDWTTFQDLAALPEGLDFIGPTEGTVFGRQPMIRYTAGNLQVALENPETSVLANGGATSALSNDNIVPDLIARYTLKGDWGQVTGAGLVRQLQSEVAPVNSSAIAGGISVTGKIKVGEEDDLRFSITTGEGIGRYVGINTVQDAVVDADNELDAIGLTAGFVAYHHVWDEQWRSNLTLSALIVDNTSATGTGVTRNVESLHVNLLYSPQPKLTFGGELTAARREVESGLKGELYRLQFSAKYAF